VGEGELRVGFDQHRPESLNELQSVCGPSGFRLTSSTGANMRIQIQGVVLGLLALVALTGCASTEIVGQDLDRPTTSSTPPDKIPEAPQADLSQESSVGTDGQLIPIQSDNVQSAGYDAATGIMTVLFYSGQLYEYYDVPAGLWEAFVAAQPDPWSMVGDPQLVKGGYQYQRIG